MRGGNSGQVRPADATCIGIWMVYQGTHRLNNKVAVACACDRSKGRRRLSLARRRECTGDQQGGGSLVGGNEGVKRYGRAQVERGRERVGARMSKSGMDGTKADECPGVATGGISPAGKLVHPCPHPGSGSATPEPRNSEPQIRSISEGALLASRVKCLVGEHISITVKASSKVPDDGRAHLMVQLNLSHLSLSLSYSHCLEGI